MANFQRSIEEARSWNLENTDIATLESWFSNLLGGYVVSTIAPAIGQKLFRGVKYDIRPINTAQLSYPPPHLVRQYGRLNLPGESMFYSSVKRSSVPFELRLKIGERAAISRWQICKLFFLNHIGFSLAAFKRLESERTAIPNWLRIPAHLDSAQGQELSDFLSLEFTKNIPEGMEFQYKNSIAISRILMRDIEPTISSLQEDIPTRFGGILYPAMAMKAHADNICLRPEFVESSLQLECAEFVEVQSITDHGTWQEYRLSHLDFANSFTSDGIIEWKGRPARWEIVVPPGSFVVETVEDGQLVYRDEQNQIIDPQ